MSHYCATCNGSGEVNHFGQLDCMAVGCTAATERAALDAHLLALGRLHERDLVWEAYKLGQAKATQGTTEKWLPTAANVNALPEGVRAFVHQLSARCDPSGDVAQNVFLRDQCEGLQAMYRKAADALAEVVGCFHAAECEGLAAAVEATADEHLKDLIERRLMYALYAAEPYRGLPAVPTPTHNNTEK